MTRRTAVLGLTAVNLLWGLSFPLMKLANLRMAREHGISPAELETSALAWFTFQSAMFLIALRFVFNQYLGTHYPLLPTHSYPELDYPYQFEEMRVR